MTPEQIAEFRDAIASHPHFGIGGDALSKILDALEAAQAEIADLKRGGVVEIELSEDDWIEASDEMFHPWFNNRGSHNWRDTYPEGITVKRAREACGDDKIRFFRRLRTIPADRVLGEGDRVVGREEWMYLAALERYARKHGPESIQDVIGCLDHLRSQATQELAP